MKYSFEARGELARRLSAAVPEIRLELLDAGQVVRNQCLESSLRLMTAMTHPT